MNGVTSNGIFSRSRCANRFALDEVQLVVPWIHLHASADRKRRNLLRILLRIQRRRGNQAGHVRTRLPRCALIRFELPSGGSATPAGTIRRFRAALCTRIVQKLHRFFVRAVFLRRRRVKAEMLERVFVFDEQFMKKRVLRTRRWPSTTWLSSCASIVRGSLHRQNVNQAAAQHNRCPMVYDSASKSSSPATDVGFDSRLLVTSRLLPRL